MCPACLAAAAALVLKTASVGGMAAYAAAKLHKRTKTLESEPIEPCPLATEGDRP